MSGASWLYLLLVRESALWVEALSDKAMGAKQGLNSGSRVALAGRPLTLERDP
jgi:hypothetical protein